MPGQGSRGIDVLRDRSFRWYFAAYSVSMFGTAMVPVALSFAVLHLTGSAGGLAQVLAARTVAVVACLPLGGVVSDKVSRVAVLQTAYALTAVTQGVAAALIVTGNAQLWQLTAIEALNGAASAFTLPAMTGMVPLVTRSGALQQANSLLGFSRSGLNVVGPSLGGLLVVATSAGWALAVDAAGYLLAILALSRIGPLPEPGASASPADAAGRGPASFFRQLSEGWGEFTARRWVWLIVAVFAVLNAVQTGAMNVFGPVIATSRPTLGEAGWGLVLGAGALGTVVMALVLLRVRVRFPLRAGMLGITLLALPIALLGARPEVALLVCANAVAGMGVEVFSVGWTTALQERIPGHVLSRVSSYDMLGSFVAIPLGTLVYGVLATHLPAEPVLLVSAGLYVVLALGALLSGQVRSLRAASADQSSEVVPGGQTRAA